MDRLVEVIFKARKLPRKVDQDLLYTYNQKKLN